MYLTGMYLPWYVPTLVCTYLDMYLPWYVPLISFWKRNSVLKNMPFPASFSLILSFLYRGYIICKTQVQRYVTNIIKWESKIRTHTTTDGIHCIGGNVYLHMSNQTDTFDTLNVRKRYPEREGMLKRFGTLLQFVFEIERKR